MQLDVTIPSTRFLQQIIRDQNPVRVRTQGGESYTGRVRWQDHECLCLATGEGDVLLWRAALCSLQQAG